MTEKRISEFKDMKIETSKDEKEREQRLKKHNRLFKNCGTTTKGVTYSYT